MVLIKKELLLESDFSMCLGYLWKYELRDPDDPSDVIARSIQIKKGYVSRLKKSQSSPARLVDKDQDGSMDDFFDFDTIEGDSASQVTRNSFETKNQKVLAPSRESKQKQQASQK